MTQVLFFHIFFEKYPLLNAVELKFFSNINSHYQTADLNVLFQSLFSFKTFLTKFSEKILAVMLLLQCSFF